MLTAGLEKVPRFRLLVGLVAGLGAMVLAVTCGFPSTNPVCWEDLAAAAGLRPASAFTGGLVRAVYAIFFSCFPHGAAFEAVRVAGYVAYAVAAFLACEVLSFLCGTWMDRLCRTVRGRLVVGAALLTATFAFVCSDPVWYSFQSLGADGLRILLALAGTYFQLLFVVSHRSRYTLPSMFVWALVAGDSPFGLVGAFSLPVTVFFVSLKAPADERLSNPLARMALNRALSAVFLVVFCTVVAATCGWWRTFGFEEPSFLSVFGYIKDMTIAARDALPWTVAVLAIPVVLVPVAVSRILRDRSMDDERFMPVNIGVAHIVIGILAWTQLSGAKSLCFTRWLPAGASVSAFVHAALLFLVALTLLWTIFVLGSAVFIKRPRNIARFRYADAIATAEGRQALERMERSTRFLLPIVASLPLVVLLTILPFRYERTLLGMLSVVRDGLVQTVDECSGRTRVFTDGKLDAGLELEAFRRDSRLFTVSLLAGNTPDACALRDRGITAPEDLEASARGPVNLLRTWANDNPQRLSDAAVQLAFELWHGNTNRLVGLGLVALPPGAPVPPSAEAFVTRGRELGTRIVALYDKGSPDRAGTPFLREAFRDVQWRLSRLGQLRAESAGRTEWGPVAVAEQKLADRLHTLNVAALALDRSLARIGERNAAMLTPREGLKLGLDRADFKLASLFASHILLSDPEDPQANFAVGMNFFLDGLHARAEPHLKRCLAHRPDDPAVLNNLAVVELRLGRWDEAERYARTALDKMPKSVQIQRTLAAIGKARLRATGRTE